MRHDEKGFTAASLDQARITGGFWEAWQRTNREVTIPYVLDKCDETGRTQSLRLEWTSDADWQPHQFYDSDLAKALEAASYSLHQYPDAALAERVREYIRLLGRAQQPDGYLNTYYTQTGIEKRWTNLRDMHELYCAGHLFEAAVAHFRATGERSLLDIAVRYADHIDARFGPAETKAPDGMPKEPGYPGHEEIELALVKLADATGERRYLELARFFVDARGHEPHYFRVEAERRGEPSDRWQWERGYHLGEFAYYQAHEPVRDQTAAEGHSVRACYLFAGMVDVAVSTGDERLLDSCRTLFTNIATRRMYVTGGVGSHSHGERFTVDYDLPNESAYAETCAAIALVFFASRLVNAELDGRYADVMERALYNGVLGGLSLSGDRFFYANPLAFHPTAPMLPHVRSDAERQPWYGCACCPPNIVRLIASLPGYLYSVNDRTVAVHLYAESSLEVRTDALSGTLTQQTAYPWDGEVTFTWQADSPAAFTLALRIPQWADDYRIVLPESAEAGTDAASPAGTRLERGYLSVERTWNPGDEVRLTLPMRVRRTRSNAAVRQDGWRVALERGPLVYCAEEVDNGPQLATLALPADAAIAAEHRSDLLGGCTVLRGDAVRSVVGPYGSETDDAPLYTEAGRRERVAFTAVPYALRNNRGTGEMRVWMAEL